MRINPISYSCNFLHLGEQTADDKVGLISLDQWCSIHQIIQILQVNCSPEGWQSKCLFTWPRCVFLTGKYFVFVINDHVRMSLSFRKTWLTDVVTKCADNKAFIIQFLILNSRYNADFYFHQFWIFSLSFQLLFLADCYRGQFLFLCISSILHEFNYNAHKFLLVSNYISLVLIIILAVKLYW